MTKRTMMMQTCPNTISGEMTMRMRRRQPEARNPLQKIHQQNHQNRRRWLALRRRLAHRLLRPVEHPGEATKNVPIPARDRHDPIPSHRDPTADELLDRTVARAMHLAPNPFRPGPAIVAVPVLRPDPGRTAMATQSIDRVPITDREVVRPFGIIRRANTRRDHVVRIIRGSSPKHKPCCGGCLVNRFSITGVLCWRLSLSYLTSCAPTIPSY